MSAITTHILDTSTGTPAARVAVILERRTTGGEWESIAEGISDADGRLKNLMSSDTKLAAGDYRLNFDVGTYFLAAGGECFFPQIIIRFIVKDAEQHYHVPLLVSPFGYSTYRGS